MLEVVTFHHRLRVIPIQKMTPVVTGDGDGNEDDDDIYTDVVHQSLVDHVRPFAAGTEIKTAPTVSSGGVHAVEPYTADIHPQDEQEGYERGRRRMLLRAVEFWLMEVHAV
jgi:hypothetical protein